MVSFRPFFFALLLGAAAFGQANRSGCSVLTLDEVTAMLGPDTTQRDVSGACIFAAKKATVTVTLTANAGTLFQMMKLTASQNGATVKEEPSIGIPAFSVVDKDGHGFSIFMLKGTSGGSVSADTGPTRVPDPIRERLRGLAKKAAGRM